MPRPGPRREAVAVRMSDTGRERLDTLAAEWGVSRSEVVRRVLAHGLSDEALLRRAKP